MNEQKNYLDAVNLFEEYKGELINSVLEQLKGKEGKKIFKVDGSRRQDFNFTSPEIRKPILNGFMDFHCWLSPSEYSNYIDIRLKLCYSGGKYEDKTKFYHCLVNSYEVARTESYPARLHNITSITIPSTEKEVYNLEEVVQQAEEIKEMIKAINVKIDAFPYRLREVFDVPQHIR